MFDAVTTEELRRLARPTAGHQISLFMPTHPTGLAKAQDPILLRQLIEKAKQQLVELGMRGPDADALLAPAGALVDDVAFWTTVEEGLAVFVNTDGLRHFRLGHSPLARSVVANRFQLRPLLASVSASNSYWVLALSQHAVRLLNGSRAGGMRRVDLGEVPTSLEEALRFDDRESQLQSHASGRVGSGGVAITTHGQGGAKDTSDEERSRFCQLVDGYVRAAVLASSPADSAAPLVLAGDRRLLDDYRKQSQLGHIVGREVVGNPDDLADHQLGDAAWDVVREELEGQLFDDIEAFGSAIAHRTSTLDETLLAAVDGKVESLIVPLDTAHFGELDHQARHVTDHAAGSAGVGDLFDLAVAEVLRHGGRVHAVAPASVPGSGPVAARLRY